MLLLNYKGLQPSYSVHGFFRRRDGGEAKGDAIQMDKTDETKGSTFGSWYRRRTTLYVTSKETTPARAPLEGRTTCCTPAATTSRPSRPLARSSPSTAGRFKRCGNDGRRWRSRWSCSMPMLWRCSSWLFFVVTGVDCMVLYYRITSCANASVYGRFSDV
ncbi:unnamed protein product [Ectocarpus sp. 13 AM-2016]